MTLRANTIMVLVLTVFAVGCYEAREASESFTASPLLGDPPDTNCTAAASAGRHYWLCSTQRSWATARTKCQGAAFDLATVDSLAENTFLVQNVSASSWIGANDQTVEGVWRWKQSNAQFWQGSWTGSPVGGLFNRWATLQPDNSVNEDCGLLSKPAGTWLDVSCSLSRGYVCELFVDHCLDDPDKMLPGACGCGTPETDTDDDGTPDCNDGCFNDPNKIAAGACGCGTPDTDMDGDGALDCDDACPDDPRQIERGQCGCLGDAEPAGTACSDGLCSANTTCDGAGTCGDPDDCAPDIACDLRYYQATPYWICENDRPFSQARQLCVNVGMDLAVVETASEDAFITSHLEEHSWVAGSDSAAEGEWVWLPTGQQFWTGGQFGDPFEDAYTNWDAFQPNETVLGLNDCMVKDPAIGLGRWLTRKCADHEAFVCERVDACPFDPQKRAAGQCGCGVPDKDDDDDGVANCIDECRDDPSKSEAGVCGCGVPDDDGDGDGIIDCKGDCPVGTTGCMDECPNSNDVTAGGECGCPDNPVDQGVPCSDGFCGPGVCDGAGHCGAPPSSCPPVAGGGCNCVPRRIDGHGYWYCACNRTRDAAEGICETSVYGTALVQIDNAAENQLISNQITATTWLGANDRSMDGQWRWTSLTQGDNGRRFWDGDESGASHAGRYSNWLVNEPGGNAAADDCASMSTGGTWQDVACTSSAHVLCEVGLRRPPRPRDPVPPWDRPGTQGPPTHTDDDCVPVATALPATEAELEARFDACYDCQVMAGSPEAAATLCAGVCIDFASPPPPGSECVSLDETEPETFEFVCPLVLNSWGASPVTCTSNGNCMAGQTCGRAYFCRFCADPDGCPCGVEGLDVDDECPANGSLPNYCQPQMVCGQAIPECDTNFREQSCEEITLCSAGTLLVPETTYTDWNDTTQLTPIPTDEIANSFPPKQPPPDADKLPGDPACPGAPDPENCPSDQNHRWCHYDVADAVPDHNTGDPSRAREPDAGDGLVRFKFTPEMDFDYKLIPGPFGLMKFDVGAHAALRAAVSVNILGASKNNMEVVNFRGEFKASLNNEGTGSLGGGCGISTSDSELRILGLPDILPATFKRDLPAADVQADCVQAMTDFEDTLDRAKKAYFDAREMLRQYKDLEGLGGNFGVGLDGLCDQIADSLPLDFPIGADCLTLRPEEVINKFIQYYEYWALTQLTDTIATPVADAIDNAFGLATQARISVAGIDNTEEIVLLTSIFPVGPIPVTLQVMLTANYGVDASGELLFNPGNLVRAIANPNPAAASANAPLAYIGAVGAPYAQAGVALFVGAGFDAGIIAAKVGIQGAVSLGYVSLPLSAGAGISIGSSPDNDREKADDEDDRFMLVGDEPLIPMKQYSINAIFKYGGSLVMADILSGQIDVVVKIKFLFFSKKFKARLVRFNGFCSNPQCRVDLFGGGGEVEVPFELVDWATVLMPTRFLKLKKFSPANYRDPSGAALDVGRAGELFYDNLCTCIPRFEDIGAGDDPGPCERDADCCGYEERDFCFVDPADSLAKCTDCRARDESCNVNTDCCGEDVCFTDPDTGAKTCNDCQAPGDTCNNPGDCCEGAPRCLDMPADMTPTPVCVPEQGCGGICLDDDDCLDFTGEFALHCVEGLCLRVNGSACLE